MQLKKRHVTLLEVIIAMVLVSVLMAVLMGYYGEIELLHGQVDIARQESFQLRYIQARLAKVLPSTIAPKPPVSEGEKKGDFFFYTSDDLDAGMQGSSLVFTYDNGIDIDPAFSNTVLGRLVLQNKDGRGQLMLLTWPIPRCSKGKLPPKMKKEVLIDNVSDLAFEFFNPQPPEGLAPIAPPQGIAAQQPKPPLNQWISGWLIGYQELPAIVKVTIKRNVQTGLIGPGQPIDIAFPIPNSKKPIVIP